MILGHGELASDAHPGSGRRHQPQAGRMGRPAGHTVLIVRRQHRARLRRVGMPLRQVPARVAASPSASVARSREATLPTASDRPRARLVRGCDAEAYRERLSVPVRWWFIAAARRPHPLVDHRRPGRTRSPGLAVAGVAAVAPGHPVPPVRRCRGARWIAQKLRAGRATIDRAYLGKAEPLTGEDARNAFGRDCDPAAYLVLRSYLPGAVRVEITDPHDPAPYWLIATRNPERLAAALTENSVARS